MYRLAPLEPVDYLIIGHITQDLTANGPTMGGTASFSSLTAKALGLRVGIVTACNHCVDASILEEIPIAGLNSPTTTTYEITYTDQGRVLYLRQQAPQLDLSSIPETWRSAPIIHLAPVANEVDPNLVRAFPTALIGLTPQGWMRSWDEDGRTRFSEWAESSFVLERAGAAIISIEDVQRNEQIVDEFAASVRVLAVTEGAEGARVYWNGDVRRFKPPAMKEVDSVGAGDIFAAAFLTRLYATRDPWEAGRFATHLAAYGVSRRGLQSIPTADEIQSCLVEVIERN
ncbi:MAG: hypothetical protein JW987_17255 [Anaerolineaceae bacterium]|nr:hypothetical protein [Anaerolineaceae bacterium]